MSKFLNRMFIPAALLGLAAIPALHPAYTAPPPERSHMDDAVSALVEARNEMNAAGHDFCGHKGDAIKATDEALRELRAAAECQHRH